MDLQNKFGGQPLAAGAGAAAAAATASVSSCEEARQHGLGSGRPVLAVDLDEVLGYFVAGLARFHNEAYGTSLTPEHFGSYHFRHVWGGDEEESVRKVHEFFASPHFQDGLELVPGAQEALRKLAAHYDLVVVTSRQFAIERETRAWLDQHFPGVFRAVVFGNHFGLTGEKRSKPDLCRDLGAEILIDDSLRYAQEVGGEGPGGLQV